MIHDDFRLYQPEAQALRKAEKAAFWHARAAVKLKLEEAAKRAWPFGAGGEVPVAGGTPEVPAESPTAVKP